MFFVRLLLLFGLGLNCLADIHPLDFISDANGLHRTPILTDVQMGHLKCGKFGHKLCPFSRLDTENGQIHLLESYREATMSVFGSLRTLLAWVRFPHIEVNGLARNPANRWQENLDWGKDILKAKYNLTARPFLFCLFVNQLTIVRPFKRCY